MARSGFPLTQSPRAPAKLAASIISFFPPKICLSYDKFRDPHRSLSYPETRKKAEIAPVHSRVPAHVQPARRRGRKPCPTWPNLGHAGFLEY
ncbi:hypothetical protein BaRGS_00008709 [Batillaria attramentaria]|uniref:Uncharacterized protein n=1 Tax=Batillaria attramentaria TaxID=370345 RepID=A0ABD0LKV0_9CAEN